MNSSSDPAYDAVIIGAGPAGSTAATYLAKAGRKVLLLEKEKFPRFHIGESLLPYNREVFEELGVLDELKSAGFMKKTGAQLGLWNGAKLLKVVFDNGSFTEVDSAFQVERARFDQILMDRAREMGVTVMEETAVKGYNIDAKAASVTTEAGETFQGKFLVDATGTVNFTGNRENLKNVHPGLRKIAVFTHFEGVEELPDREAGDIQIFRHPKAWFWLIPLGNNRSSVGVVFDKELLKESDLKPEEHFHQFVSESPALRDRIEGAEMAMDLKTMVDFSYSNRRLASDRLLRIGDAAGFIDPIFSSGVYLAMMMGKHGAAALIETLDSDESAAMSAPMKRYEKTARKHMRVFRELIEGFYRPGFFEILMNPRKMLRLPCALNAVFAGRLDEIWAIRWRLRLFHFLTRLQDRIPIVEREGLR